MHQLEVTYENIPVPGSPFRVNAIAGCDPRRVRAFGPGLEGATTDEAATFTIETKGAGQGSLGLAIEGPSEAKMICKDNQDGACQMEYLPVSDTSDALVIHYVSSSLDKSGSIRYFHQVCRSACAR
jgi:filamin